jgi:CBS-domain-containing membrane protein
VVIVNATVKDAMTADVVIVCGDRSFKDMAGMLSMSRISALPVVDEAGKAIGVVSEAGSRNTAVAGWPWRGVLSLAWTSTPFPGPTPHPGS